MKSLCFTSINRIENIVCIFTLTTLKINSKQMRIRFLVIFLIFSLISLDNFTLHAQHIYDIGDSIEIKLEGYKEGNIEWQFSEDGEKWINIPNETFTVLKTTLRKTGFYRSRVYVCSAEYFSDTTQVFVSDTYSGYVDNIGKYLTSDKVEGRFPGTMGDTLSVAFLSEIVKKNDLIPLVKGDSVYYIPFVTSGSSLAYRNNVTTFNIVGLKEGRDILLKDEYIIVCAHYDAYGKDASNKVCNGADDNASGVTEVALLSKMFKGIESKRSILFIFTGAEEFGLMGMNAFIRSNIIEKKRIKGVFNFDGIGKMKENKLYVYGNVLSQPIKQMILNHNSDGLNIELSTNTYINGGTSDHVPFYSWAPALGFIAISDLKDSFLHTPSDKWSTINVDGIVKIGSLAFKVINDVAN